MYNRYIPQEVDYIPVEGEWSPQETEEGRPSLGQRLGEKIPQGFSDFLGGEGPKPLSALLERLHLEKVDSGDILLILIILYLLLEGDDHWDMVITLGLILILGLTEGEKGD